MVGVYCIYTVQPRVFTKEDVFIFGTVNFSKTDRYVWEDLL